MARQTLSWSLEKNGPFFRKDPQKTFRKNVRDFLDEVAELGEAEVQAAMRAGQGNRREMRGIKPARVSGHVRGRTSSLSGKRWALTAVVSINNSGLSKRQGITLMAAGAEIEKREHVFRRTTARLRKARTDLLKGLR